MLGSLGAILGSPKTLTEVVAAAKAAIISLHYQPSLDSRVTVEQRLGFELKLAEIAHQAQSQVVDYMEAAQGHRICRRVLAISIAAFYMLVGMTAVVLSASSPWFSEETGIRMLESAKVVVLAVDGVDQYLLLIIGFYFAAPHLSSAFRMIVDRRMAKN